MGYVRVSRVGGRGGDSFLSPELQREQISLAARREGLEVADVLEELDASGGNRDRPLWNEAIRRGGPSPSRQSVEDDLREGRVERAHPQVAGDCAVGSQAAFECRTD